MSGKFQALNVCVTASAAAKISSQDLICWVNSTLKTNTVYKVHELGTGEHYCLLLHMLFPFRETIPLRKIKFGSQVEVDHISNWKIFQSGLKSVGIDKELSIDRLVKQKPMDNLEFAQWMYKFFDANRTTDVDAFDPVADREKRGIVLERCNIPFFDTSPNKNQNQDNRLGKIAASKKVVPSPQRFSNGNVASASDKSLKMQIDKLNARVDDLNLTVEGLEKERDFYFSKLRDIEVKCQENPNSDMVAVQTVLDILYSTEDGFAQPE